ncbi:tail fiber protein [Alteromonas sp. D210916BOD_24]|uniref:phage tail protein n=1 Tax=Alteromonas sp. D210916BOD_24 TaxID=3157618 RepID=UPI00399D4473
MEPLMAQISTFGFKFTPRGWVSADGQLVAIQQYAAVFSVVGTTYGGDGRTTFAVPDMRGRKAIGSGTGHGLPSYEVGQKPGSLAHTITISNLPPHNHSATFEPSGESMAEVQVSTANGNVKVPEAGDVLAVVGDGSARNPVQQAAYVKSTDAGTTVSLGGVDVNPGAANIQVGNTGAGEPFSTEDPGLVVNYCFALAGGFPSRN